MKRLREAPVRSLQLILPLLILNSVSAFAVDPHTAQYVCSRVDDSLQSKCQKLIAGDAFFDSKAAGLCDAVSTGPDTMSCLKSIKNHKFVAAAIDACSRISVDADRIKCLQVIADHNYSAGIIKKCDDLETNADTISCFDKNGSPFLIPPVYSWKMSPTDAGQVVGCLKTDKNNPKGPVVSDVEMKECTTRLETSFQFAGDSKTCQQVTTSGAVVASSDIATCVKNMPSLLPYWIIADAKTCGYVVGKTNQVVIAPDQSLCNADTDEYNPQTNAFTLKAIRAWTGDRGVDCGMFHKDDAGTLTLIKTVDKSQCMVPSLTYFQWNDASSDSCVAYSACGAQVAMVDKSYCAGKENKFAHDWPARGFTWNDCYKSGSSTTIPFDAKGNFIPHCAPDALYMWHPWAKVRQTIANEGVHGLFKYGRSSRFFMWRTPIGSYGYGDVQLRLKLKPDVKFKWVEFTNRECSELAKKYDIDSTVFADEDPSIGNGDYSEYVVCSEKVFASWSYDRPQNVREMELEYKQFRSGRVEKGLPFDSLFGTSVDNAVPWSIAQDWDGTNGNVNDWSEQALANHIGAAKKNYSNGRVYFRPSDVPSLWNHYSTAHPGYFNYYDATKPAGALDTWPERQQNACYIQH